MSLAHLTLATREVEKTAAFLEKTLGYGRDPIPENSPCEVVWLNIGRGQQMHVLHVEDFAPSPFEREFGRHVAVFYPRPHFDGLKQRLGQHSYGLIDPPRATPVEAVLFRGAGDGDLV